MIKSSSQGKFIVKEVKASGILDFKQWCKHTIKRMQFQKKSNTRREMKGYHLALGLVASIILCSRDLKGGKVPIKASKITDLQKVMKYVPSEHVEFYEDILGRPVDNAIVHE
ncbi:hypothetical protein PR048_028145 [Dryococelus australis]|uniref:Uncharacterized protein n=1 Tax=Dryococelus australis TaxID=614101 RepID=A0ABQ9GIF8_9NEOP|nr:hypothetical protein PR048_028145 [Dryococelus australis]